MDGFVGANAYLGNGIDWNDATSTVFSPPFSFPYPTPTQTNSQLVDINGDGLQDWVYSDAQQTYTLLNNGHGWDSTPSAKWSISTSTLYHRASAYFDRGMRFIDINGDGLLDFVRSYQMTNPFNGNSPGGEVADYKLVLLNTGSGWATSTAYSLPAYITTNYLNNNTFTGPQCFNEYADVTGNGQDAQDVLSTITYPQGGTPTFTYKKTTQQATNPELPYSILTVVSITNSDGLGTSAQKNYTYSGGLQYAGMGIRDRRFAGFANVTETDANTKTTTYFDQGSTIAYSQGEQNDGWGQINHPYRVDVAKASDGSLLRQTFNRWDTSSTTGGNGTFVFKAREVAQDYGSIGNHRDTATDYSYSTSTGSVTQIIRYGEVTGNSDGTFTDSGSDKSTENFLYAVSTTTQAKGLVYDDTVLDQSSNKVRETRHTYDGLALGSVSLGNETKTENWITGSTYASTTRGYDGTYGLATQSRDADYNLSTSTLDTYNLYIATTTNPLFQTTGYSYDYSTGKVKTTFDANGQLYTTTYDGVGRPLTANEPDPSTGSLVTKTAYAYTDSNTVSRQGL